MANATPDDTNLDTTHLSDAELHDVVTVATAFNEAESMYLGNRLEESGIPVLRTAESVNYFSPNPRIRVPRTLQKRAQEVIETARAEAKARALEDAFNVEEVDEKDAKKDPLIRTMTQLKSLPQDQKLPELALYIIEWFAAGRSNADIARYLSLAGLTPDEARALVADVYENQRDRIRQTRESNASTSPIFTALGILLLLGGYLGSGTDPETFRITRILRVAGIASLVFGLSKLATSKAPSRLEEPMPKNPAESEKTPR